MAIALHKIRQAVAARIALLDATPYAQGTSVTAAWNESRSPFGQVEGEGDQTTHLEYAVVFDTIEANGQSRYAPGTAGEFGGTLIVNFRWDIDPGDQRGSYDLAMQAAHDLVVSLNDDAMWADTGAEVQVQPVKRFDATLIPGVLAMLVEVTFDVRYEEVV